MDKSISMLSFIFNCLIRHLLEILLTVYNIYMVLNFDINWEVDLSDK